MRGKTPCTTARFWGRITIFTISYDTARSQVAYRLDALCGRAIGYSD